MYIRGNKLIKLLEEFQSTKPKKEDRIPYGEWRKLVNFLTNTKDLKLQVKTEPSTLIITCPPTDNPLRFNTGDYFIKFFQERPITTIFPSPKFEHFWGDNKTFIIDNDGNQFITSNSDLELSDYRISDVEHKEVYIPVFNPTIIIDPCNGQPYYQNSDRNWEPLTKYYDTDSTSSSDTLNISTPPYDATTINTQSYLQPFIADWENPPYSAEKATEALKNLTEKLSKGSSNKMNINLNNLFDFGPINDNVVMYSPYGLAFRNSNNQYLTYNPTTKKTTDVTGLTIDLEGLIYKIPVGLNSVKPGDIIIHNGKPICVEGIVEDHSVICVDIENSELKTVIPPTNIFGFNYVTKITPLFNLGTANPSEDNPFGNIMPYFLFSTLSGNGSCGNGFNMQTLLLMSLLNGNADGNFFGNIFGNGQA